MLWLSDRNLSVQGRLGMPINMFVQPTLTLIEDICTCRIYRDLRWTVFVSLPESISS